MKQVMTMNKKQNLSIEEAMELFIKKAQVRNLSPDTLKTYQCHFSMFCRYTDKKGLLVDVTEERLDGFVLYLRENTKANPITVNTYLRSLRAFFYFCMDNHYMKSFKIVLPKAEKKVKDTYTSQELELLLKKPDIHRCSFTEYRMWVFENYLLGTGNRLSSALNVKIGDIDFDNATIIIRKTKNRSQQIIPLSKTLSGILQEYLEFRNGNADDYLFCSVYGQKGTRRAFQDAVADYNLSRGVTKTSIHMFRHTFSKNWILAGGDIFRLQKILGHSDLSVTKEYIGLFSEDLQVDFEQFNPLDRMSKNKKRIQM